MENENKQTPDDNTILDKVTLEDDGSVTLADSLNLGKSDNVILPESNGDQGDKPPFIRRVIRDNGQTEVVCVDNPGTSGACHEYMIGQAEGPLSFCLVDFQDGPIKFDEDVNGCQQEDLLAIVIDRLECFQAGPYPCKENSDALMYARAALKELDNRTADRKKRGVEGTNQA